MGIKSTRDITRATAIDRIYEITSIILRKDYRELEAKTHDPDYDLKEFIDSGIQYPYVIDKYTNRMLEDIMDCPFYRFSMFDNYCIKEAV